MTDFESVTIEPPVEELPSGLVYVSDNIPGFSRVKKDNSFVFVDSQGRELEDDEIITRCRKLVLPPAWERVWICPLPNGHLQATGYDTKNRKQYRYHPEWSKIRNETKYSRMLQFSKALPVIRERIKRDLSRSGLPKEKVLALAISLLERTSIRIGNEYYKNLYGSFGLTTLRDKHVKISGSEVLFQFKGKKGVFHSVSIKNRKLANLIAKCKDIPGYELFQYYDESGNRQVIDSGMVNSYIKEIAGFDFSAKDFRTWTGTVQALQAFREIGTFNTKTETKRNIVKAIDMVSEKLGNTRTVCKKYYIHPAIIDLYENGCIFDYLNDLDEIETEPESGIDLTCEEKLVVKILETIESSQVEEK